ncbi:MAG: hypothetical protein PHS66_02135 [Candidatus Omnitrophica bacterium]|nr:hypothetical protein [Candidatus Omnitrophota bacterium]
MNMKQLMFICLIAAFLCSGCGGKPALAKGGGKYTIPFDLPYDNDELSSGRIDR